VRTVIVFDADNTLWDTNAVFRDAQLELLRVFEKNGLISSAEEELTTLREIDRALISRSGDLEYDFKALASALARYYTGTVSTDEAADHGLGQDLQPGSQELINRSCRAFDKALKRIPPLDENVLEVLTALRKSRSAGSQIMILMFSDGKPDRLKRVLEAHHLDKRIFDDVVISKKSVTSFENLKRGAVKHLSKAAGHTPTLFVMIGDSLQRDIAFANRAGFTTVYKPADFFGEETPSGPGEEPNFRISSLAELLDLLEELGVPIQQRRRATMTAV
jgi:putative hydrolase of the HAD superfamily